MSGQAGSFVRLVVGPDGGAHKRMAGLIQETWDLHDAGRLSADESALLRATAHWLEQHLPVPPFETAGWHPTALCWFRSDATVVISRMWDLAAILREHGQPVQMLRSTNPGRILYEDDLQVVVEPWNQI